MRHRSGNVDTAHLSQVVVEREGTGGKGAGEARSFPYGGGVCEGLGNERP
jgi:hypothetical protein